MITAVLIDLHVHTCRYSGCSSIQPEELATAALKLGLDGIALTEHGILWPPEPLAELRNNLGSSLKLLAGQEVSCYSRHGRFEGEFLVFGVDQAIGSHMSAADLIETVHRLDGVVIAAHPYKPSRTRGGYYGIGDALSSYDLDALELGHPDHDPQAIFKGASYSISRNIPATSGSDAHSLPAIGAYATLILEEVNNEKELAAAIKRGVVVPLRREGTVYVPLY